MKYIARDRIFKGDTLLFTSRTAQPDELILITVIVESDDKFKKPEIVSEIHRSARTKEMRRIVIVTGLNNLIQADLLYKYKDCNIKNGDSEIILMEILLKPMLNS